MEYHSAEESRKAYVTYHLVPEPVWSGQSEGPFYVPEAFPADEFIHFTNGLARLRDVGNMFYSDDWRDHVVLAIDTRRVASEIRYDDPDGGYPHIHGALNTDAVIGILIVERAQDGAFVTFRSNDSALRCR
jgi:uncharacterized protein (DUF952 family)